MSEGCLVMDGNVLPALSRPEIHTQKGNSIMRKQNSTCTQPLRRFRKALLMIAIGVAGFIPLGNSAQAQLDFGADVVSRYIWRGTDFGDAVSAQPWISYSANGFEVGAWSSWAWDDPAANENDLYVSYSTGLFGVAVTDYYFRRRHPLTTAISASSTSRTRVTAHTLWKRQDR